MPKVIPDCPTKPSPKADAGRSYEITLITPMFGGGAEPRINDPGFPIRPTAIRGQLQFWWRATVSTRYPTVSQLRAAQSDIWGSTDRASRVQVAVENVRASQPAPCAKFVWDPHAARDNGAWRTRWQAPFDERDSALPYVLFPFQGQPPKGGQESQPEQAPDKSIHNASFCLRLRCPESLWPEVEEALWAWVNFGGIGSRTRRGCGALFCRDFAPPTTEGLAEWYKRFVPASTPTRRWPTLPQFPLTRAEPQEPLMVWNRLIGLYRCFRQGEDLARNPGPGRSPYPEAETIRRITRRRMRKHEPQKDMPDGFPRAELGMPIVFHFKDEDKGEPPTTTLYPFVEGRTAERMASPLILKPLALAQGKAIPLILCLSTPGILAVELQDEKKQCLTPAHAVPVRSSRFAAKGSPLHGRSDVGSAVEAFMAFAQEADNGFKEVAQ